MANQPTIDDNEAARRQRAARLFTEPKLDALYVTSPHNIRYLTGFTGSNGALLLFSDGHAVFFTDPRYTVQSKQQVTCKVVIAKGPLTKSVLSEIARAKSGRVGFEQDHLTVGQFESLRKTLPVKAELVPVTGLIERLRMVKDAAEIALIRASVIGNSRALESALKRFHMGMTESELAAEIDYKNRKFGAEAPAFDTIVAAGPRAALPHAHPGHAKIDTGILLIDMGAFRNGYASDMTRMAYVGRADAKYKRAYKAVLEAQLAAIHAIKPGALTSAVDRAARQTLKKHGLEREFIHSTGHGLGLDIHEQPRIGKKDKTKLEPGMAITVEPGVYIEGWGGIRIEDTVLVTETGCEILTATTKELREIC
ncbi:MAG TPA: Xaa-Pro peptidase family protein [Bryobacteraceae bacterium]|jgi:Xaa-Pro aminopeptidase|nr:Xaa-Pro peptidase family protein [Bryobacteraceae bacterium]